MPLSTTKSCRTQTEAPEHIKPEQVDERGERQCESACRTMGQGTAGDGARLGGPEAAVEVGPAAGLDEEQPVALAVVVAARAEGARR
eukprot:1511087-Pleurochrysis_carterae.AAC.1